MRGPSEAQEVQPRRWSLDVFRAAYDRFEQDNAEGLAAGLAYGALLSIAPLLLVVLGIASMALGEGAAREQLETLTSESLGPQALELIDQMIADARAWSGGATAIGLVVFVLGSARLVSFVIRAFDLVFDVPPPEKSVPFAQKVRAYATTQAKSVGVTLACGVLIVVSMVVRSLGESLFGTLRSDGLEVLWVIGRELASTLVWAMALAIVYRALPPIRLNRGDVLHGALVSAVLVSAVLLVLRLGASHFELGAAYGAASAIVGTLVILYVVAQLFLFGAEVTAELASRRTSEVRSGKTAKPARSNEAAPTLTPAYG